MHYRFALCLAALFSALPAVASSPDAWDEHYRSIVRDCLKASTLKNVKTKGSIMLFSDAVGAALLLRGDNGKKKNVQQLCMHGRGNGPTEIQPVQGGLDPNRYR